MKNIVLVHCIKYEELPRYCFKCGTRMTFVYSDEYGNCHFICPACQSGLID